MKRKTLIVVLSLALLITLFGCRKEQGELPEQPSSALVQPVAEITDPVELQKLWEEYFYHTIANVGNTQEFNSAAEIDPLNIAKFAFHKYDTEYGRASLKQEEGRLSRVFPLETVLDYAKRYFELSSLDVSRIDKSSGQYDWERQVFFFNLVRENETIPEYNSGRDWPIKLTKVTQNSDGTLTAVLTCYDNKDRAEYTSTYTLKEREDGSLYFVSGKWEYLNNNLVSLTGDYQRFDRISGLEADLQNMWMLQEVRMLGEFEEKVLLMQTSSSYQHGDRSALLLVNPDKMEVEKKLNLPEKIYEFDVRLLQDKVYVYLKDRFMVIDPDLSDSREIPLPAVVADRIAREEKIDENGIPDIFFGGYDVSADQQQIVYSDETGLKLLNLVDGSEKMLAESVPLESNLINLIKASYHRSPRFVADEQKVITTMTAYEGTLGYTLCDLHTGEVKKYEISSEASNTGTIRYDNGLLEVNAYRRDGAVKTLYLDFRTGELTEIAINEPGDTDYIRDTESTYIGRNYAAFITTRHYNMDNDNNMAYLNRINLETFQVEEQLVSVKAAETNLLGVLADGRMLFWYIHNPSESGICITK